MTEQMERLVAPAEGLDITGDGDLTSPAPVRTPVLITEAEIVLSTAAAVPLRPSTSGWVTRASRVVLAIHQTLVSPSTPRHYPKRLQYLEDARMEREMDRL